MSQQITIKRRTIVPMLKAIGVLMFVMLLVPLEASVTGSIIAGHALFDYSLSQGNYFGVGVAVYGIANWFYTNVYMPGIVAATTGTLTPLSMALFLSGGDLIEFFAYVALLADPFTAAIVIGGFLVSM
ncbi:hypothetical protein [Sulfurisphaera ohwakuensis]|uniref:Uncharacterized protein n=2 Tax=Sulfurisphaera ohwakuensis TaxID=69656 RepID=A0A650CFB1_SULOH|nr:hypothetical protein [Sulfurisphaera ohwakuensis]MBB5255284.1 hypothetical protein [Sulfurisphaera ohwakuensis]QGR16494.1 hypothetical protein D1869_04225 [Sulfurisphaera ohwakuensis]